MGKENSTPKPDSENAEKSLDRASAHMGVAGEPAGGETTFDPGGSEAATAITRDRISIGPYVLVRKLGEGGMGQVWLAEQTAPVKRQVALKLIKGGMYDSAVIQRFESERQSLALMNHPAIAKVFDAGSTSDGQPYFVMEYVDGPPITRYCDHKKLKIRERLELLVKVCEGVQHAHQKAIIHRDLKPSNVLVVEVDGKPVPRIIDFGLAKAISAQPNPEQTQFTQMGAVIGTRGFMSPEQADPNVLDVDTRTDVYSLGVVLYVLLTGMLPFDSEVGKKKPTDELLRELREEDPPSPSSKLSTEKDSSTAAAERRGTEPKQLVKLLQGDLDWITMKAVERDRARRYGTPSELAADIERYLENRPVVARPASAGYRLKKYVQRHRMGVAAASGAAVLLVAFAITQAVQLRRITRERDRANRITEFMTGMFKMSDPSEARGNSITAREVLDNASKEIDTGLTKDPELQARLMFTMGKVYLSLGLDSSAQSLLERALGIQRRVLGSEHPETLESATSVGKALRYQGHYPEAEKLERQTLEIQRRVLGPHHPSTLTSISDLANTLFSEGHYPEAEKLQRDTLEIRRRVLGPQHPDTLSSMNELSTTLTKEAHYADAEKLQREVLDIRRRVLGPNHPETLGAMNGLGNIMLLEAHFAEAEKLYREGLAIHRQVQGAEHPDTLVAMGNLADTLSEEGHYAEAEKLQRETLDIDTRILGPENPQTLLVMENLSITLGNDNRLADAEKLQREIIEIGQRVLGPEQSDLLETKNALARNLQREGRYVEAEKLERETLDTERRVLGPEAPETLESLFNLGDTLQSEDHYAEAEKLQRETLSIVSRVFGPAHPNTLSVMTNLGETLEKEGQLAEAEKLQGETLENVRRIYGANSPQTLDALQALAICLSYEKRYDEAKPLFAEAVQIASHSGRQDSVSGAWYSSACGAALAGHPENALEYLRRAIDTGYSDIDHMANDKQLKSLRGNRQFEALVAEARKRAAAAAQKAN
jgi:serine/threonine protein kinase/tetratricopeptide (TPR) repeat protein